LHAGILNLQSHTQNMWYWLLLHGNSGYVNALHCYVCTCIDCLVILCPYLRLGIQNGLFPLILRGIFLKFISVILHVEHNIWRSEYDLESSFRFVCIWLWTYFVSNFCVRICVRFQVGLVMDTVRPWLYCVRIRVPFHVCFFYGYHASVLRNCLVSESKDPMPVMWKPAIGLCHEAIHPFPILPIFLPFVSFIFGMFLVVIQ